MEHNNPFRSLQSGFYWTILFSFQIVLVAILLFGSFPGGEPYTVSGAGEEPTEERTAVLELFTETWCGPCENADLATDEIRDIYADDELIILEYHYDQGGDPFFTEETNDRFNRYYDFNSWPSAMFDGILEEKGSGEVDEVKDRYSGRIDDRLSEKSHFWIEILDPQYQSNSGYVRAYISERTDSGKRNISVSTIIYRDKLHFDGGNGILEHRYVVRAMFSDRMELPTDIIEHDFSLPDDTTFIKDGDNVGIAILVQDDDTKEILQSKLHIFNGPDTNGSSNEVKDSEVSAWHEEPKIIAGILSMIVAALLGSLILKKHTESRAISHIQNIKREKRRMDGNRGKGWGGVHPRGKIGLVKKDPDEFTECPHCKTKLKTKNLDSHMNRVHAISGKD